METFTVAAVIDGNTFAVSPPWELEDETGDRVRATGYDAPKSGSEAMAAEQKLSILIQNRKVELGTPHGVDRGRLVCDVYFQGMNLADYFPEYRV
ncbi:MAG TPA: thermonuclease family protein [Dehalococcoidia bacterium]|nr:thermonuclease family protein [Dehalococcoidia bacterium]